MSGLHTRQIYDYDASREDSLRMMSPYMHRMDLNYFMNSNTCFPSNGPTPSGQYNPFFDRTGQQVNLDSALSNRNRIQSKAVTKQMPQSLEQFQTNAFPVCDMRIEPEYSRFVAPASEIRGMNPDDLRLDYPLFDPQAAIFQNFEMNTRLAAKDNFVAPVTLPRDQTRTLPRGQVRFASNA